MVGREIDGRRAGRERATPGDAGARARGRLGRRRPRRAGACRASRFDVRAGEIVAVAGVAGNGQRELAEAIAGHAARRARARSRVGGRPLRGGDPREAIARRRRATCPRTGSAPGVAPSLSIALERRAQVLPRPRARAGRCCASARSATGPSR